MKSSGRPGTDHPLFRIAETESPPHGDVYECDVTYYYDVIEKRTGKKVLNFQGESSSKLGDDGSWVGSGYSGVRNVLFDPDGIHVLVFEEGTKNPRRVKIPSA